MEYKPVTAVWEITMGCNMRCKHCGSSCKNALPDELTTEEALKLCDDIGKLGLKWITISGGEPLTRDDWHLIAKRLRQNNVIPNIITNAWCITEDVMDKAVESGIGTFAISLDGVKETHDFMRCEGSFDRIMSALDLAKEKNVTAGIITTVSNKNIGELEEIKKILIDKGVTVWQLQIGLPMGNLAENGHMLLKPEQIDDIIDFTYGTMDDSRLSIYPADCIGYYNLKEVQVRSKAYRSSKPLMWQGCTAGKRSFGILHNGDILGCTSIRDRQFIEGNVRDTSLIEIWNNENSFSWSRKMSKEKLKGLCTKCKYGSVCLGGCPNTRLTMNGDIYSENKFCSYNVGMCKAIEKLNGADCETLRTIGKNFVQKGELQLGEIVISKALEETPNDKELLDYYGFTSFMLGNYSDALEANQRSLELEPQNVYANKGMGLSLAKLGRLDEGKGFFRKSLDLADENYMDPYYDFAVVLIENGLMDEAACVIEEGKEKSPSFMKTSEALYKMMNK